MIFACEKYAGNLDKLLVYKLIIIFIILIINSSSKYTTENTEIVGKKSSKTLQVEKLRIMFVPESKIP